MHKRLFITMALIALVAGWFISTHTNQPQAQDYTSPINLIAPQRVIEGENAEVGLYYDGIQQGRTGLVAVSGVDIASVTGSVFTRIIDFAPVDNRFYALIAVNWEQAVRTYEFVITVTYADGSSEDISVPVDVRDGGFLQQTVRLTDDQIDLLDEELEAEELALLLDLARPRTSERLWDLERFSLPVNARLTSTFGAVRQFINVNDTEAEAYNSRHTGWDFEAGTGAPMTATANGRVVYAGYLPIRGNYVMIDHGWGVYSGYAHLSVVFVTQGQPVSGGQLIGRVGSGGRSSSAHAHWEMIVDEQWVDPVDFTRLVLP